MTDLRKAAEDMLETLDKPFTASKTIFQAKEALRQALAQPEQEPVAHLWECIGRWTAMIAHDGKDANLAPPDWLIDAVKAATAPVDAVNMSQECVDETVKGEHEPVAEGLVDYIGRKLRVKTTKGKPDLKNAPRWATALGQTPQGAWHWLEKNGPIETPDSDRYFPLSGKTEFTGFVSKYEGKQGVEEECWACGCDECVCADILPKRPLTDAEAFLAMGKIPLQKHITDDFILAVVRATEAAHGISGEK